MLTGYLGDGTRPVPSELMVSLVNGHGGDGMYLWRANVLPRASNTPGFKPSLTVDPLVPGTLDEVLNLEDGRDFVSQTLVPLGLGLYEVRGHHLDISIAAESS